MRKPKPMITALAGLAVVVGTMLSAAGPAEAIASSQKLATTPSFTKRKFRCRA